MFDWIGWRKGLPLWVSWRLNARTHDDVRDIFEGIAQTRKELLQQWAELYWSYLDRILGQIQPELEQGKIDADRLRERWEQLLEAARVRGVDFSELFVLSAGNEVIATTYAPHYGKTYGKDSVIAKGLAYAEQADPGAGAAAGNVKEREAVHEGRKCLFGPYADPLTLDIGPSTSSFHDEMTLLFIAPIIVAGQRIGMLCGRVPNDVVGDLIQRESGHIYADSGDNYIFMARAGLNTHIPSGTALSRSRFEDQTFAHGDNLKDGIATDWGTVRIKKHTELEIMFTDPATGKLHPGVANTIANGSNLFVAFPGYSDYRHIPVIGKGITFQLPHCPDVWGMMCEGDLEEVYRNRGISWRMTRLLVPLLIAMGLLSALAAGLASLLGLTSAVAIAAITGAINVPLIVIISSLMKARVTAPMSEQLREINRFIRRNAEGKGDLTQRLAMTDFTQDEIGDQAKWLNNFIDSQEGIMIQVKHAADDVRTNQTELHQSTGTTAKTTQRVSNRVEKMLGGIRKQLQDLDAAKDVVGDMKLTLQQLELAAAQQIAVAQEEVEKIGGKMSHIALQVSNTNETINSFVDTTRSIEDVLQIIENISSQTHLLALNASIEAARVGEHGKGFAVVAAEIRKLSESTRSSVAQIQGIIEQIYRGALHARRSMEEGNRVVSEGEELVTAASHLLRQANESDEQKAKIVDEVVALMENITAVSIGNRKLSSEAEEQVAQLKQDFLHVQQTSQYVESIAAFLQQLMGQFTLNESKHR